MHIRSMVGFEGPPDLVANRAGVGESLHQFDEIYEGLVVAEESLSRVSSGLRLLARMDISVYRVLEADIVRPIVSGLNRGHGSAIARTLGSGFWKRLWTGLLHRCLQPPSVPCEPQHRRRYSE